MTPWTVAYQTSLSIANSQHLLKLISIELVMPSNHLILCHLLLLLPSIFPSIRVFSNESVLCIRWPKYWIFSFNISPSNEYSGLISFRMDWLDLLAIQGTLKSLLQHHSSNTSVQYTVQIHSSNISDTEKNRPNSGEVNGASAHTDSLFPASPTSTSNLLELGSPPLRQLTQRESESHSVMSDPLRPHGLYSPWNSSSHNTGVGSLSLLQGIFPTQG